jgi:hypothetical protein
MFWLWEMLVKVAVGAHVRFAADEKRRLAELVAFLALAQPRRARLALAALAQQSRTRAGVAMHCFALGALNALDNPRAKHAAALTALHKGCFEKLGKNTTFKAQNTNTRDLMPLVACTLVCKMAHRAAQQDRAFSVGTAQQLGYDNNALAGDDGLLVDGHFAARTFPHKWVAGDAVLSPLHTSV